MLMYHAVLPGAATPSWPWAVSMKQFCDQLDFLVTEGYATPTMRELAAMDTPPVGRTAVITFDDGYVNNLAACDALLKRGIRATWFMVTGSIGQTPHWPADGRPDGRLLSANELRDMHDNGMEIGSHTVNHTRLTALDDTRLKQELMDSRSTLRDLLNHDITSFAYPYGDWDARCAAAVREAGYAAACTTQSGWTMRDQNAYTLRRLTVFNTDTVSSLARKLATGANDVAWPGMAQHLAQQVKTRLRRCTA